MQQNVAKGDINLANPRFERSWKEIGRRENGRVERRSCNDFTWISFHWRIEATKWTRNFNHQRCILVSSRKTYQGDIIMIVKEEVKDKKFEPITIKITIENQDEFNRFHTFIGQSPSTNITDSIYEVLDSIRNRYME